VIEDQTIDDNVWLFTQEKNAHVIHLFTLLNHTKALEIAKQPEYQKLAHIFTTSARQQQWTFVLLGPYENEAKAQKARDHLPAPYAVNARVRAVSVIAKNRCTKRAVLNRAQASGLDAFCLE